MSTYTEIQKDDKTYLHDTSNGGYYGVRVEPGSPEDNTRGKIGIHWEYLQYAAKTDLVLQLRSMIQDFQSTEDAEKGQTDKIREAKERKEDNRYQFLRSRGLCPHCYTFCDGDCRS